MAEAANVHSVGIALGGVPQRRILFESGSSYVLPYTASAAVAIERLQRIIEASGAREALLAPYLYPHTSPHDFRKEIDRALAGGFTGTLGVFVCMSSEDGHAEDRFIATLLAIRQVTSNLPIPAVSALRLPCSIEPGCASRLAATLGLVPITDVRIEHAPSLPDSMLPVAEQITKHAKDEHPQPFEPYVTKRPAIGFAPPQHT